jgi:hypothetical protein
LAKEPSKEFVGDWARAAAVVVLTRRRDLTIVETKKDTGLDFHVSVEREDNPMRLTFGLLLRAVPSPVTIERANQILKPTMGFFQGLRKFTYPVCLFFFTMRDDQAFFSWLAEPVVVEGAPKLIHHDSAHCVPLTNEFLDQSVERIVAWYEVVEAVLIA